MNNNEKSLKELAPCGIDCYRCASNKNGEIAQLSRQLKESLKNFENFIEDKKKFMPIFEHYDEFLAILNYFSQGYCEGCRNTDKPACQCSINSCIKEHNVDFCFECSEFPCTPKCYSESLLMRWKENNLAMKKNGAENFYIEQKKKPRY